MKLLWALVALLVAAVAVADDGSYRLPLEAVPLSYEVSLVPFLDDGSDRAFTFDGLVNIEIRALKAVPVITLHANDLTISTQDITVSGLEVVSSNLETLRNFLTINLNEPLTPGELYNLTIRYEGNIGNNLAGFYRSSYKTTSGETRWLAVTQFEATDARRAFPSFDEPALKATFVIRIAPPTGYFALANMPVESITGPDPIVANRSWYNFQKSIPMSSYLVAFLVSDFAAIESGQHRILGRPSAIDSGHYALSVAAPILDVMVNLTGVEYFKDIPKMDQVAVPDFSAGAMENWGLVTYRQAYLLPPLALSYFKRMTATVMAHEFAHQWFGNMVSPDWWTFTWLNEAFASFFEYFDTDKVEPDWNLLTSMVTSMQHNVMRTDGRLTTHAITRYVETPSEIMSSFDTITYSKGGALVKMVYHFLTEPTFFKGLNIYLKNKSYGAAVPDDLFDAWQQAAADDGALPSDLTVNEIMATWTLQAGYPVVSVERDYDAGTATLTQQRFLSSGSGNGESWWVPISYTTQGEKDFNRTAPRAWLPPNGSLTLRGLAADEWLVLNIQDASFIRVNYDQRNWNLLMAALQEPDLGGIHPLNRAQLNDDASQLGVTWQLPADFALEAAWALRHEPVPAVRRSVLRYLATLYDRLANSDDLAALKGAFAKVVENWSRSKRSAESEEDEVLDWTYALSDTFSPPNSFRTSFDMGSEVSPAVLCAAVRLSDAAWDVAWSRYHAASTSIPTVNM